MGWIIKNKGITMTSDMCEHKLVNSIGLENCSLLDYKLYTITKCDRIRCPIKETNYAEITKNEPVKYLFLDIDPRNYEFFTGKGYARSDVEAVKNGQLAIVDLETLSMMVVFDNIVKWVKIDHSVIRDKLAIENKLYMLNNEKT